MSFFTLSYKKNSYRQKFCAARAESSEPPAKIRACAIWKLARYRSPAQDGFGESFAQANTPTFPTAIFFTGIVKRSFLSAVQKKQAIGKNRPQKSVVARFGNWLTAVRPRKTDFARVSRKRILQPFLPPVFFANVASHGFSAAATQRQRTSGRRCTSLARRGAAVILALLLAGCSLDYGKEESSEDNVPEFSFTNAHFTRVEERKRKLQISAEKLEQYKSDNASFASGAAFKTFDKDEQLDTEGTCGLIAIDSKNEHYRLFNNIAINIASQDTRLRAENLQFNGKTEQLTSGRDDIVSVERKNATVSGKGFSASGVSRSYTFLADVSGVANVDDKDGESTNEK